MCSNLLISNTYGTIKNIKCNGPAIGLNIFYSGRKYTEKDECSLECNITLWAFLGNSIAIEYLVSIKRHNKNRLAQFITKK